jgi:hypothetical protein
MSAIPPKTVVMTPLSINPGNGKNFATVLQDSHKRMNISNLIGKQNSSFDCAVPATQVVETFCGQSLDTSLIAIGCLLIVYGLISK